MRRNLIDWRFLEPDVGPGAMFFEFCDALEVKDGISAPATGWGLEHAINSWGPFWSDTYYAYGKPSRGMVRCNVTESDVRSRVRLACGTTDVE